MAHPRKGDDDWEEYKAQRNARRRERRQDPAYREMERKRWAKQATRRKAESGR